MKERIISCFFSLIILLLLSSCLHDEVLVNAEVETINRIEIKAEARSYDPWEVLTRGDSKDEQETKINTLQLFIFDKKGNYLTSMAEDGKDALYQSLQYVISGSFILDRILFDDQTAAKTAHICILANRPELSVSQIRNYSDLEALMINVSDFKLSDQGFPMFGDTYADLSASASSGASFTVDLKSLMARVDFNITLKPSQSIGYLPSFQLVSYKLCNLPQGVMVGVREGETIGNASLATATIASPSDVPLTAGKSLSFHFYMAEHKCLPQTDPSKYKYPDGISEDEKQRYKPLLAKKEAAYVELHGFYVNHSGVSHTINYKVYLGANHTDNFQLFRNHQYKNNITIVGITNHDGADEGTISMDHRVNITYNDFLVSLERETVLDCHIEVRPLDITLPTNSNGRVDVEIVNPSATPWFRLEMPTLTNSNKSNYCATNSKTFLRKKRKYFTEDLVTQTLKNNYKVSVSSNTDNRVWLYFDENLAVSEEGKEIEPRTATLKMTYYGNSGNGNAGITVNYTFKQHPLRKIKFGSQSYYTESIEEYLYNFDPKDDFGITTDGMAWGLSGVQLSESERAINFTEGFLPGFANWLTENIKRYYDYNNTKHPRNGKKYSEKLISKSGQTILSQDNLPRSAVEYCYNKNKRSSSGKVSDTSFKWYLPGTDEIEDIVRGGYTHFKEFQQSYYWSSQPSYDIHEVLNWVIITTYKAQFDQDNLYFARTAKVISRGVGDYTLIQSESHQPIHQYTILITANDLPPGKVINGGNGKMDEGNKRRTEIHRVRAIRADNK